tara:strand:- start:9903 stop:10115 length:213 start_codon:yes stop_codon:yes gene_type:complete
MSNEENYEHRIELIKKQDGFDFKVTCPTSNSTYVVQIFDNEGEASGFIRECKNAYQKSVILDRYESKENE